MKGEFIFDMMNLVVMKERSLDNVFYAIDRNTFYEAHDDYFGQIRISWKTGNAAIAPDMETLVIVEKERGKFELSDAKRMVSYEQMVAFWF